MFGKNSTSESESYSDDDDDDEINISDIDGDSKLSSFVKSGIIAISSSTYNRNETHSK